RFATSKAGAHWLKHRRIRPEFRMAGHASFSGRQSGEARSLNRSVAVPAVDPVVGNVMLVAEGNRLLPRNAHQRVERALIQTVGGPHDSADRKQGAGDTHASQTVRAAMKNLRHGKSLWIGPAERARCTILSQEYFYFRGTLSHIR